VMPVATTRFTYRKKLEILNSLQKFKSNVKAAAHWKCSEKTIRNIIKERVQIQSQAAKYGNLKSISMGSPERQIITPEMIDSINEFIQESRSRRRIVSVNCVARHLVALRPELGQRTPKQLYKSAYTFMVRNGYRLRIPTSSSVVPDEFQELREEFLQNIRNLWMLNQYDPDFVVNFDQTAFFKDYEGNRTIEARGTKSVVAINSKEKGGFRSTVCLAVTASGKKLTPFVIFKGTATGSIARENFGPDIIATAQSNAWMDTPVARIFLARVLLPYIQTNTRGRSLILMDNFSVHCQEEFIAALTEANCDVIFIPKNCTSRLQPLDVSVNEPFKAKLWNLRQQFGFMEDKINVHIEENVYGAFQEILLADYCKAKLNRRYSAYAIANAFSGINENTIINGFIKSGILGVLSPDCNDLSSDVMYASISDDESNDKNESDF
jgi:hypothetical protein